MDAIHTPHAPEAVGPYSQAVRAQGLVFLSGQIGLNPETMTMVEGGVEAQAEQIMKNLEAVLLASGSSFKKVIKTTIYLQDIQDFAKVGEVYAKHFTPPYPARVTIEAQKLPLEARVEMDMIAELDSF